MRTAEPQTGESARFLAGLYQGLGARASRSSVSSRAGSRRARSFVFQRHRLSTVDGIDTELGRLALVLLLAGADPGDYGVRDTADDGIVPPIVPLPLVTMDGAATISEIVTAPPTAHSSSSPRATRSRESGRPYASCGDSSRRRRSWSRTTACATRPPTSPRAPGRASFGCRAAARAWSRSQSSRRPGPAPPLRRRPARRPEATPARRRRPDDRGLCPQAGRWLRDREADGRPADQTADRLRGVRAAPRASACSRLPHGGPVSRSPSASASRRG